MVGGNLGSSEIQGISGWSLNKQTSYPLKHTGWLCPLLGNEVIQNSFGHSKVVLPSQIIGTVLLRLDMSAEVLHFTKSCILSVINTLHYCLCSKWAACHIT